MKHINVYETQTGKCIASYDDFDYFVVDLNNQFIIKPDFISPGVYNIPYKFKNYFYKKEDFNGTKQTEKDNAAIDDNTSKGLIKTEPKTSKAQLDAVAKYQKSRAEIRLRVSPEIKRMADANAKYKGLSLTAYISQLIEQDTRERAAEDLEQWKDDMQLMDENGLDEPIALNGLNVDIRDFDNMNDAIAETNKRHKEFYGI